MKIGVLIEPRLPGAVEFAVAAERIGVASLWVPEVWGYDALTGLAYLAAKTSTIGLGTFVVQLGSRSPAMLATSALSLQELSGGRFMLGVGTSGPRVMEGWHGVRFRRPVQTTRETIEIIRTVSRGERLEHAGEIYPLPLPDSSGTALRPLVRPDHVPVYVAAMGPHNLRLTGEVADGWLGNAFIPEAAEVFLGPLREGAAAGRPHAGRPRSRRARRRRIHRRRGRRRRRRPPARRRLRVHHRRDGGRRTELLQRRVHPTGLRRRGGSGRRAVAGGQPRRGPRRGAARSRPAHQSGRHRRGDRRTGATATGRRASPRCWPSSTAITSTSWRTLQRLVAIAS